MLLSKYLKRAIVSRGIFGSFLGPYKKLRFSKPANAPVLKPKAISHAARASDNTMTKE